MKLFGEKEKFAAFFELDPIYEGILMYGRFGYWLNGHPIGDHTVTTSLCQVLSSLTLIVKDCGHREHSYHFSLSPDKLFNRLSIGLYGGYTDEYDDIATEEIWARFSICPDSRTFQGWRAFLIDGDTESRLIYKQLEDRENGSEVGVSELFLPIGTFDKIISEMHNNLSEIYSSEL